MIRIWYQIVFYVMNVSHVFFFVFFFCFCFYSAAKVAPMGNMSMGQPVPNINGAEKCQFDPSRIPNIYRVW